jgi:hypothetical protein
MLNNTNPPKTQWYTRFSWSVGNTCSTSGTRLTNHVTNHVRRQRGYTRFSWRAGNICSISGTRLTNPVTNHVRWQRGYTRFPWRVGNICSTSGTRLTNPANVWSSFWPPDYTLKKSDVIHLCVLRWHFRSMQWPTRPCEIFYDTRMKHSKRFTTLLISYSLRLIVFIFPDH